MQPTSRTQEYVLWPSGILLETPRVICHPGGVGFFVREKAESPQSRRPRWRLSTIPEFRKNGASALRCFALYLACKKITSDPRRYLLVVLTAWFSSLGALSLIPLAAACLHNVPCVRLRLAARACVSWFPKISSNSTRETCLAGVVGWTAAAVGRSYVIVVAPFSLTVRQTVSSLPVDKVGCVLSRPVSHLYVKRARACKQMIAPRPTCGTQASNNVMPSFVPVVR